MTGWSKHFKMMTSSSDSDIHITDVEQYVRDIFTDEEGEQNSNTILDVATCYGSSLPLYLNDLSGDIRPQTTVTIGSDESGRTYYTMCMTYIILREKMLGTLPGSYEGMISYVPMVLSGGQGVFIDPGNAWPLDTVGMSTFHRFADQNIDKVPDISAMPLIDALNHLLLAVVGGCAEMPDVQKFVLGFNILKYLAADIKRLKITNLENGIQLNYIDDDAEGDHDSFLDDDSSGFDVNCDWRPLISVLIFRRDCPSVSNAIEKIVDFLDGFLLTTFDYVAAWDDEVAVTSLISIMVRLSDDILIGSYENYMDNLFIAMDGIEDTELLPPGLKQLALSFQDELDEHEQNGYLDPIEIGDVVSHNNGTYFTDTVIEIDPESCRDIGGIRVKRGIFPLLNSQPSSNFSLKYGDIRAQLSVQRGSVELRSSGLKTLYEVFEKVVAGVLRHRNDDILNLSSHFQAGETSGDVQPAHIHGSVVVNIVLCGMLGTAPGLWLLSHIVNGQLTVSPKSTAQYAKAISVEDGTIEIHVPLHSAILRSIHCATDNVHVYSIWSTESFLLIQRDGHSYRAVKPEQRPSNAELNSCTIVANRLLY